MILDRIEPDLVHPGRLAAHRGWAGWGLAMPSDVADDVVLLVPAHDARRLVPEIVRRVAEVLERPAWPPSDVTITVNSNRVLARGDDTTTALEVVSHPWYLPTVSARPPGEVVGRDRRPVIDEATAVRERVEAIDRSCPTVADVDDVARWITTKAVQARQYPLAAGASMTGLLTRLRRDAPDAYTNVGSVVDFARKNYTHLPNRDHVAGAFRILTNELASIERGRSR